MIININISLLMILSISIMFEMSLNLRRKPHDIYTFVNKYINQNMFMPNLSVTLSTVYSA